MAAQKKANLSFPSSLAFLKTGNAESTDQTATNGNPSPLQVLPCFTLVLSCKNVAMKNPAKSASLSHYELEQLVFQRYAPSCITFARLLWVFICASVLFRTKLTGAPFRQQGSGAHTVTCQFDTSVARQACHELFDGWKTSIRDVPWVFSSEASQEDKSAVQILFTSTY